MPFYLPQQQGILSTLGSAAATFVDEQQRQKANAQQMQYQQQQMQQAALMAPLEMQAKQKEIENATLTGQATKEQIDAYKAQRGIDPTTDKPFAPLPEEQRVIQHKVGPNYKITPQDQMEHYMRLSRDYYKQGRTEEGKNAAEMAGSYAAAITQQSQQAFTHQENVLREEHEDWRTRYTQAGEWGRAQFTADNQAKLEGMRVRAQQWMHDNPSAYQKWQEQNYNPQALFKMTSAQMKSNDDAFNHVLTSWSAANVKADQAGNEKPYKNIDAFHLTVQQMRGMLQDGSKTLPQLQAMIQATPAFNADEKALAARTLEADYRTNNLGNLAKQMLMVPPIDSDSSSSTTPGGAPGAPPPFSGETWWAK